MNQYERQNAAFTVDGYFLPTRCDTMLVAFLRAKGEAIVALRRSVENLESLTFEQFLSETKRKTAPQDTKERAVQPITQAARQPEERPAHMPKPL